MLRALAEPDPLDSLGSALGGLAGTGIGLATGAGGVGTGIGKKTGSILSRLVQLPDRLRDVKARELTEWRENALRVALPFLEAQRDDARRELRQVERGMNATISDDFERAIRTEASVVRQSRNALAQARERAAEESARRVSDIEQRLRPLQVLIEDNRVMMGRLEAGSLTAWPASGAG